MARSIQEETKRARQAGENVKKKFESTFIHDTEMNSVKEGDILIFSEDYEVIDRKIRGSEDTTEMMYVKCKRSNNDITVPFYPSLFWKSRQVADANKKPTGEYRHADGEVVDFIQSCGDLNEAIVRIAKEHPNGVKVAYSHFQTLRFGQPEDGTGRTHDANIPTLTWA